VAGGCANSKSGGEKGSNPEDGQESTADKHYKVALGSFHNNLFDDSRTQLQRALASDPTHGPARYLEGLMFLQEGKTMLDAIEGEMCLQDASSDLQRDRVDELHRKAHESFRLALEGFDDKAAGRGRALNSMAVVSLYFRDYDRAAEEAEGALKADFYSERFSALANLGWAYYNRGDNVEAMTELRQSVLLNPDFCVARYRLAQVYLDFEMNEQALDEISRVLGDERCPIQDARRVEGVAKMRMGDSRAAAGSFDACIAMAPRSCLADECEEYMDLASSEASMSMPPAG
jgi:tetratricopeptide (TPR) repeat protein